MPQNLNRMDLKKEDEENVAYQEEAPAVPPKIPDSHLDKVTFIAVYLFQYANCNINPKLCRLKCI